jgi:flagellar motor switch protein FliN/FliY
MTEKEQMTENEEAAGLAAGEKADTRQGDATAPGAASKADRAVEKAQFETLARDSSSPVAPEDVNLEVVLDIPVTVSAEIGRTRIPIRSLLQLSQGSVVELDRLAGDPLDVFVNGTLIAHGEVVVVNEKFGIRLTDVISPSERVKKLR